MGDIDIKAELARLRAKKEALLAARGDPGEPKDPLEARRTEYRVKAATKDEALPPTYSDDSSDDTWLDSGANGVRIGDQEQSALQGNGMAALGGFDKSTTLGLGGKLADVLEPGSSEAMAGAATEHPAAAIGGSVAGAFAPLGAAGLVGKAANGMAGMKAGQGLLQSMGRGTLAGAGGGATLAAGQAAVAGEDPLEAGEQGFKLGAMLGPLGGALQWGGNKMQSLLRDPGKQMGRDIAAAERAGGTTHTVSGIKPGAAYQEADEAARAAGNTASPAALSAEKTAPLLGQAVQGQMDKTLGSIKMQNEAAFAGGEQATLQPVLAKQMQLINKATQDGQLLPGQNVRDVVSSLKRTAKVQVVPRDSDIAHGAEAENMMPVGLARHIGLVKGAGSAADAESVVVLTPRSVRAEKLETMRRGFDDAGRVQAGVREAGAPAHAKAQASAAREAREAFGPERVEQMVRQSDALRNMKNTQQAAGLPREAEGVSMGELDTDKALYDAVRNYRSSDASLPMDRQLDKLAASNPQLRKALDDAAGVAATQRLRGQAEIPMNAGGVGAYGLKDAVKLRADPLMRYLGVHGNVLTPGAAATGARERR